MKVGIVFHSSCGSTYLVAREYKKVLESLNLEVDIFKVEDDISKSLPAYLKNALEYKEEFKSIETIKCGEDLLDYDVIFMGSPTYYGNVSGQLKIFMDSFSNVWIDAPFRAKYFGGFTTTGSIYGGGEFTLQAMSIFAKHMGMTTLSVPCNIGCDQPAYGIIHVAGSNSNVKLSEDIKLGIYNYICNLSILKTKKLAYKVSN
ncbi:MAG: NAD(P)H-dependent oxidoreductase [Romboutsia sp.]